MNKHSYSCIYKSLYGTLKNALEKILRVIALCLISLYQTIISPLMPKSCRFYPSCSEYARVAFKQLPTIQATLLIAKRLISCHPFSRKPYYDPVPTIKKGDEQIL